MSRPAQLFKTSLGTCALSWSARGVCALRLPEASEDRLRDALLAAGTELTEPPPPAISALVARIQAHLAGNTDARGFRDITLDLDGCPAFHRQAYQAARSTGPGLTTTYGSLARACGSPGAARAVGQAMARNPIPLIVPCHRVLASGGGLGGFSAHGSSATKLRMLTIEGADLAPVARAGITAVGRADPQLRPVIAAAAPFPLAETARRRRDPFSALAESIIHQQVSMRAGATIFRRLSQVIAAPICPEAVLALGGDRLRAAGVSARKASYLGDLARQVVDGHLRLDTLRRLDDETAVQVLTRVRGIGRWSAQMFLMFHLGRLDVLPTDDLGLRKGAQSVYGMRGLPGPEQLQRLAEPWIPFRSIGSWYLWRALDAGGLAQ